MIYRKSTIHKFKVQQRDWLQSMEGNDYIECKKPL